MPFRQSAFTVGIIRLTRSTAPPSSVLAAELRAPQKVLIALRGNVGLNRAVKGGGRHHSVGPDRLAI